MSTLPNGKKSIGIICDFDGPLFDTDKLLDFFRTEITKGENIELFNSIYEKNKSNISSFSALLEQTFPLSKERLHQIFFASDLTPFLRPESRQFINTMEQATDFHIITKGDPEFQKSKLDRLEIKGTPLEEKNTFIVSEIQRMREQGATKILVIDDRLSELQKVFEHLPEDLRPCVQFIHMEVGRHGKEGTLSKELEPYLRKATHLSEINAFIPKGEPAREFRPPETASMLK